MRRTVLFFMTRVRTAIGPKKFYAALNALSACTRCVWFYVSYVLLMSGSVVWLQKRVLANAVGSLLTLQRLLLGMPMWL